MFYFKGFLFVLLLTFSKCYTFSLQSQQELKNPKILSPFNNYEGYLNLERENLITEFEASKIKFRCPPIDVIVDCTCRNEEFILRCDKVNVPPMQFLNVKEIIITNAPANVQEIKFDFIPKYKCPKIHLENNTGLKNIDSLIIDNPNLNTLHLINNSINLFDGGNTMGEISKNPGQIADLLIDQIDYNFENLGVFNKFTNIVSLKIKTKIKIMNIKVMGLKNLKYLDLSNSKIIEFDRDSLSYLNLQDQDKSLEVFLSNVSITNEKLSKSGIFNLNPKSKKSSLTIHLENNNISNIPLSEFGNFVTNRVRVYLDGNNIECPFDKIKWVLDPKFDSHNYLFGIICNTYNKNIFDIPKFDDQTYPSLPPAIIHKGNISVTILEVKLDTASPSYVAVCFNGYENLNSLSSDGCELCARDSNKTLSHKYENGKCKSTDKRTFNDDLNLVFGIADHYKGTFQINDVIGLAFLDFKSDVFNNKPQDDITDKEIPLYFSGKNDSDPQSIIVQISWYPIPDSTPIPTLPTESPPDVGILGLNVTNGKFKNHGPSYVAVCINDDPQYYESVDTDNCLVCGRSDDAHTDTPQYAGPCELDNKPHKDNSLLVFAAANVKDSKLNPNSVTGLAMITIKDALAKRKPNSKKFKLDFDQDEYIEGEITFTILNS